MLPTRAPEDPRAKEGVEVGPVVDKERRRALHHGIVQVLPAYILMACTPPTPPWLCMYVPACEVTKGLLCGR